jgi:hypothetical protein
MTLDAHRENGRCGSRVDQPEAGHYQRRLVKGGPQVGVIIYLACPMDPFYGHPLERSRHLLCKVNGEDADAMDQWTWVAGSRISEAEYRYLLADAAHAMEFRPTAPRANPQKKIDWLTVELPF